MNILGSIIIDAEDTVLLIGFLAGGGVGENYPKVTEVSIQWLSEIKCPLKLRNKIALCLTQVLIRKTNMTGTTEMTGKLS